jgi:hypothetical protein
MGEQQFRIQIQKRDVDFLIGLFESRMMTLAHASALHFGGRREAAKKRIQKLKAAGLVAERTRQPHEPSILQLARKGYEFIREVGIPSKYPVQGWERLRKQLHFGEATLNHELDVVSLRAAVLSSVRNEPRLTVSEFCTWSSLLSFEIGRAGRGETVVRPDGFFRLYETTAAVAPHTHAFFVEVDRSTETLATLVAKARAYGEWYRSGGFAVKCGESPDEFKSYPFRVLVTCRSSERRDNIARALLVDSDKMLGQVWLSTQAEAVSDPLGPVWVTAKGFRCTHAEVRQEYTHASGDQKQTLLRYLLAPQL